MATATAGHVHRLNGIGCVNHLSDVGRVTEELPQARPVAPPGLPNWSERRIPFTLELREPGPGLVLGCRAVNQTQIGSDFLALFPVK